MDIKGMIAAALRNFAPQPAPAVGADPRATFGQDGVAARVNGGNRDAYLQYVEQEISGGRQPKRYADWVSTLDPMTSQVEN